MYSIYLPMVQLLNPWHSLPKLELVYVSMSNIDVLVDSTILNIDSTL